MFKNVIIISVFLMSTLLYAKETTHPSFSAFEKNGRLYITILDDCTQMAYVGLDIEPSCKNDRQMKKRKGVCTSELLVTSSRVACMPEDPTTPKVFTVQLNEEHLSKKVNILNLKFAGENINVAIRKSNSSNE